MTEQGQTHHRVRAGVKHALAAIQVAGDVAAEAFATVLVVRLTATRGRNTRKLQDARAESPWTARAAGQRP